MSEVNQEETTFTEHEIILLLLAAAAFKVETLGDKHEEPDLKAAIYKARSIITYEPDGDGFAYRTSTFRII